MRKQTKRGEPLKFFSEKVLSFHGNECLLWPYARNADGRPRMQWDGKMVTVSRLVCEMAHGGPPTPRHEAAHSCGNGHLGCVSPSHITWKTKQENEADKKVHGTALFGDRSPVSKLTSVQASEIKKLKGHLSQRKIGKLYNVDQGTIRAIHQGRTWAHV